MPFEPVLRRSLVDDLDHLVEELIAEDMAGYRDELVEDPALFLFCTSVHCAIIGLIAQLLPAEIAPNPAVGDPPMTTAASDPQIVPRPPAAAPALRAADQGVADALQSVLSDHTKRVYQTQWRLFNEWCGDVGLRSLPADPLTVARSKTDAEAQGTVVAVFTFAIWRWTTTSLAFRRFTSSVASSRISSICWRAAVVSASSFRRTLSVHLSVTPRVAATTRSVWDCLMYRPAGSILVAALASAVISGRNACASFVAARSRLRSSTSCWTAS